MILGDLKTADARALTWLMPVGGPRKCRKVVYRRDGKVMKKPLGKNFLWRAERVPLDGVNSLFEAVGVAVRRGDGLFIHGALTEHAEQRVYRGGAIPRWKEPRGEKPATIYEVPRHVLMLDIDEVTLASLGFENVSSPSAEEREGFVRAFLSRLPAVLQTTSVVYQWTAGAGIEGDEGNQWLHLKLRLFYWLQAPQLPSTLKAWLKWAKVECDDAIYSANQPVYVASPIFKRVTAPLAEHERVGIIRGERDEVLLDEADLTRAQAAQLAPKRAKTKSVKVSREVWRPRDLTPDELELTLFGESMIREGLRWIRRSSHTQGRHNAIKAAAVRHLAPAVLGQHISPELARTVCIKEAQRLGLGGDRLTRIADVFNWALRTAEPSSPARESDLRIIWGEQSERDIRQAKSPRIRDWLRKVASQTSPEKVTIAVIPAGAGKTHSAVEESLSAIKAGERRLLAVKTEELALEIEAKALLLDASVPVQIIQGALKNCHYAQDFTQEIEAGNEGAKLLLENLRHAYAEGGRDGLCGRVDDPAERCEYARTCEGAQRPKIQAGALVVTTHAMLEHLKLEDDCLVYFDELPSSPVAQEALAERDLLSLRPCGVSSQVEEWSRRIYSSGLLEPALRTLHASLAAIGRTSDQSTYQQRRHGKTITLEEIDHDGALASLGAHIISERAAHDERVLNFRQRRKKLGPREHAIGAVPKFIYGAPPRQIANKVRSGLGDFVPSRKAWQVILDIAEAAARGVWLDQFNILIQPDGRAQLERSTPAKLPMTPLIALDATGDRHERIWSALAGEKRSAELHQLPLQGGAPNALWVESKSFTSGNMIERYEGGVYWSRRCIGATNKLAEDLQELLIDGKVRSLGILTHKFLADLLRAMVERADMTVYERDEVARELLTGRLSTLLRRHLLEGGELELGHFGADDVGSNKMQSCDGLVIVGSPNGDLSAQLAALQSLGCDALTEEELALLERHDDETRARLQRELEEEKLEQIYGELTRARLSQSFARLRSIRREGRMPRLLYLGHVAPSEVDICAPSIDWRHRKATSAKAKKLEDVAASYQLERDIDYVQYSLRQIEALGVSRGVARRLHSEWYHCTADEDELEGGADPANPFISGFHPPLIMPFAHRFNQYLEQTRSPSKSSTSPKRRLSEVSHKGTIEQRLQEREEGLDELIRSRWRPAEGAVS